MNANFDRLFDLVAPTRTREIRVSIEEFKGRPILTIRRWIEPYDGQEGDRIPSKQGLGFSVEHLPCLIAVLIEAEAHAAEHGLITAGFKEG